MFIRTALTGVLLAVSAAAAAAQEHRHDHGPDSHGHGDAQVQLIDGLGTWSQPITTSVPDAQRYFDQGLRLAYGFNHDEAARSFEEALRLDPSCAMCAWGVAYALSPNINLPMSDAAEARALAAIRRAQQLSAGTTPRERDLIAALAKRFGEPVGAERARRDSAYARAMREVAKRYADDMDAQVLYADAMLNLRPWQQWTRSGAPQPGTLEVVDVLERVLARTGEHAGACHFYVHAVEASPKPERALPCAERLPQLMPGAGHVVHMPAHVYLRVGRYEDAARANIAAVEADNRYFATNDVEPGVYPLFYHPHNLHFLWAAYMMSGQRDRALGAANALVERVSVEMARGEASLQSFMTAPLLTHVRFGDWNAVLSTPAPDTGMIHARAMWRHARGVAQAALGDLVAAGVELDSLRAIAASVPDDMVIIVNRAKSIVRIAELVLEGRIAAAGGETDAAVSLLREAARIEDALTYDEPPPWYQSVRQLLGDVLLASGRYVEAETEYRADLRWVRENGWSLAGLEMSLRGQGKTAEADAVGARLKQAWQHADAPPVVPPTRTRFREARLQTGARIHWAESGNPAGAAVVLLHGISDSWFSWSRVMPLLPADLRVVAIDLRGHGNSGDTPAEFTMDAMAADVAALMDELGILSATVVGHSMGTLVAQAFAAKYPARVDGLALVGALPHGDLPAVRELRDIVLTLPEPVPAEFIREFQVSTVSLPLPDAFMERVIAESGKLSNLAWRGAAAALPSTDYRQPLSQLRPATILLWGERDAFFSLENQKSIVSTIPGTRLVTYAEAGHAPHWELPERLAADLVAFIRRPAAR